MRRFLLAATSIATAFVALPALAQDTGPDAPFTGPRAGVLLGYDRLQPGDTNGSAFRDRKAEGLTYGGDVGYDAQLGGVVLGAEGEITGSTARVSNKPFDAAALGYGRVKAGRDLYLGGRVGFVVSPRAMVYAKAGYTNQRLDLTASDGTTVTGNHYNLDGYRIGGGVEASLTPRTYAKLEYRYSNYGDARLEYASGGNTNNFSVDTDRHQVVAGVGFRF